MGKTFRFGFIFVMVMVSCLVAVPVTSGAQIDSPFSIKRIKYKHIDGSSEKLDAETYQKELNSDDFGTVGAAQDSHICPKPTQIINSGNTIIYWSYN